MPVLTHHTFGLDRRPLGDRFRRTIAEVARELGIDEALLGRWVADERWRIDAAATTGDQLLYAAERTKLARLRSRSQSRGRLRS